MREYKTRQGEGTNADTLVLVSKSGGADRRDDKPSLLSLATVIGCWPSPYAMRGFRHGFILDHNENDPDKDRAKGLGPLCF